MQALLNGSQFKKLLEKEYRQLEREYKLKKIDIQILQYLSNAGQCDTAKDIVALGLFTKGHVSQSLASLRAKGLICAIRDQEDARCIHLQLTSDAIEIIHQIEVIYQGIMAIMFQGLTEEEIATFKRVGRQILQNISACV